jgi:hypothetical protein
MTTQPARRTPEFKKMKALDSRQNGRKFSLSHRMGEGRAFAAPEWIGSSGLERLLATQAG